jgi:RNA polymerase sigma-70 factor (ECF subfamily)
MDAAESEQFTTLWTAAQPTITAFIRTLVPDFQQSEEVLQRVAIALFHKYRQYDARSSFFAWAVGVAKYEILFYRRQHATDRHVFDDDLVEELSLSYEQFVDDADPYREALEACLDELQGRPKQAITLRYQQGLEASAIAKRLRLSPGAVRILLWRARAVLRECVEGKMCPMPGDLVSKARRLT